jgi:hypothetical protein
LIDNLWALALAHLPELPQYEATVNQRARLTGRNLEPWRALLAVAAWLDDQGVAGLYDRMETLSMSYQGERPDLEIGDLTALIIRAINAVCAMNAINEKTPPITLKTAEITAAAQQIVADDELDFDQDMITSRRVGRVLGKMRLASGGRQSGRGARQWVVTYRDLEKWTLAYGLELPDELKRHVPSPPVNGVNGGNGVNGATPDFEEGDL